jgi:hypothetical protein
VLDVEPVRTSRVVVESECVSLAAVPPGEIYQATCRPDESLLLAEVLVRDFTLVELYVGNRFAATKARATVSGFRVYHLESVGTVVPASLDVRVVLKNETDRSLLAREANFEKEHR